MRADNTKYTLCFCFSSQIEKHVASCFILRPVSLLVMVRHGHVNQREECVFVLEANELA